jgi:hypothetical protein
MRTFTMRSAVIAVRALAVVAVLAVGASTARADVADRPWYERWYNAGRDTIGQALFFAAWPTADYQGISYQGLTPAPGGADLTVRVWGHSWLEGQIWTDVIISFRNHAVSDLRFGRHSNVFVPPGTTLQAALQALRQQLGSTAPPPQATSPWATACVQNTTNTAINYDITWGGTRERRSLPPGETRIYRAQGAQDFRVSLDVSLDSEVVERSFHLPTTLLRGETDACQDSYTYRFLIEDSWIGLDPATWTPGAEHAFLPHVIQSSTLHQWSCEQGYRWLHPGDDDDLRCVR